MDVNKADIQELLETLTMSSDAVVLCKLFSVLAAYLVSKKAKIEYIVRCRPLYDKVQEMLAEGSPYMKQNILNFLTALFSLDCEDEKNRNLVLHAQNLARVSGCIIAMCHLFTGSIMYQDTWIALINCLSEACRGHEVNQSFCAHLVPICIQKCDRENIEVCSLLQSLIKDHDRNIQLFLKSNGITVFRRDTLQFESCMQLLNCLVQKSTEAIALLRESSVVDVLRDFRTYGLQSRIGQWSKIILFYLDLSNEVPEVTKLTTLTVEQNFPNINNNGSEEFDDTANLFQNVIREVINWKTYSNQGKFKQPFSFNKLHFKTTDVGSPPQKLTRQKSVRNFTYVRSNTGKDLSFSFLNKVEINNNSNKDYKSYVSPLQYEARRSNTLRYSCSSERFNSVSCQTDPSLFNTNENKVESDIAEFRPVFVSTPKHHHQHEISKVQSTDDNSYKTRDWKKKKLERKIHKAYKQRKINDSRKELKNQSFSSRFFSAINESCTTLVKSVKNIFKSKEKEGSDIEAKNVRDDGDGSSACNYSFTNYMRIRDELLSKEYKTRDIGFDDFSVEINKVDSCKTCNDTVVLKQKLAEDEYLKQTMKKLKLGINLYGCDFKKIAKAMWPRDAYMTPNVLYNLYRKLLVK